MNTNLQPIEKKVETPPSGESNKNTENSSTTKDKSKSNNASNLLKSNKKEKKKGGMNAEFHIFGVSAINVSISIKHLSLMLKSGLALGDAVQVLAEKTSDTRLQKAYGDISEKIQNGMSLSESMTYHKKIFSEIVISIVSIGEQGGTLEENLKFLADYLKKSNELTKKVKGALMYPGIVFTMTIAEMLGVIFVILPKLKELFASFGETPKFTAAVLAIADFIRTNALFLGLGLIVFLILLMLSLRTKKGQWVKDYLSIKLPVVKSLTINNTVATFSRTLNILLSTGIPIVRALEICAGTVNNQIYKKALIQVHEKVKSGQNLAQSLEEFESLFPGSYTKMIEIGENTGSLEENLFNLYEYHAGEVEDISNNLTTLIEPLLLIFIGAMIGMLALIIIGPIYQFTGSINE